MNCALNSVSVLLMNRDERWNRQAEAIHFWPENQEILAGRDGEGGGTWLGINKKGKKDYYCFSILNQASQDIAWL